MAAIPSKSERVRIMSDQIETPVVETVEAPVAATKKVVKKASVKKPVVVKKSAKKAPASVKKAAGGPSIRVRVFNLLAKSIDGLKGSQIQEKLGLKGIPALLKDEGVCDKPRIKRAANPEGRGVLYSLTARGKQAVEKGTVDSDAAKASGGKDW